MATLNQITGAGVEVETRNVFSKRAGGNVEKTFLRGEHTLTTGDPTLDSCRYIPAYLNENGEQVDERFVVYAYLNDIPVMTTIWGPAAKFAHEALKVGQSTAKLRAWDIKVSELTSNITGEGFISLNLDHRNFKALEAPKPYVRKNPFEIDADPFA